MFRRLKKIFTKKAKKIFSKFVDIEGIKTHYLKSGHSNSKVLLIHGLGAGCDAYREMIEMISSRHEVYALDLPSFGKSQLLRRPFTMKDYIRFIHVFLKKMNLDKVTLIGHSAGGLLSIEIASNKSTKKLVKKLVIVDSAGLPKSVDNLRFITRLAVVNPVNHYMELRKTNMIKFFDVMFNAVTILDKNIRNKNMNMLKTLLFNWSYTCEPKLKKITAETLIIWGDKDELFPLEDAYFFKRMIRGSRLKIVKGYHNWICFNPSKGKNAILEI